MSAMDKSRSDTVAKLGKGRKNKPPIGKRFKKNNPETGERDERINRKGRPRSADELKDFVLAIFEEQGVNQLTGKSVTVLRQMVLKMAIDGTPADRAELLNRGFGKVPDSIVFSYDDLQKIIDYLPQDMLERLAKGEGLGDVLVRYLTTIGDGKDRDQQAKE
jgi:hypothetical protein